MGLEGVAPRAVGAALLRSGSTGDLIAADIHAPFQGPNVPHQDDIVEYTVVVRTPGRPA